DAEAMPDLAQTLERQTHHEPYRRKLRFVGERLRATREALVDRRRASDPSAALELPPHAYTGPEPFLADLTLVRRSLLENRGVNAGAARVADLIRQARTFGFHLACLDVRIPAEWVRVDARAALGLPEGAPLVLADL